MKDIWIKADTGDIDADTKALTIGLEAGADCAIVSNDAVIGRFRKTMTSSEYVHHIINDPSDVDSAISLLGNTEYLILTLRDWKIIPLENIISRSSATKILVTVKDADEARLFAEVMEKGVDGLVVDGSDVSIIGDIIDSISSSNDIALSEVTVTDVRNIGMGDRVCVDTCSIMHPGEGMLIGSSASCLFLIQSESEGSMYADARPFRVNAGSVHSYILVTDDKTKYLSEIRNGSPALIVDSEGRTRISSVGRSKMERRPLVIVEAELDGDPYSVILQNAETVRLVSRNGSVPITELRKGDKILARIGNGGRHFGISVDETVMER